MSGPATEDTSAQQTSAEAEEQAHLRDVQPRLTRAIEATDGRSADYTSDVEQQKTYMSDNRDEMDHAEKVSSRESIAQSVRSNDFLHDKKRRLQKLQRSPYFGRFDVAHTAGEAPAPVYIGVHHFHDDAAGETVVHDVLQEELGRSADEGMKNIVATIQRDQNRIVRDEEAYTLVIQGMGPARARPRSRCTASRFCSTASRTRYAPRTSSCLSPNRVFADYIANVLPELGEESVNEIGMEALADALLEGQYRFQPFFEQTAALLEKDDEALRRRIEYKASTESLRQLDRYVSHVEETQFEAHDGWIARRFMPAWLFDETFRKHRRMALNQRVLPVAHEIERKIANQYNYDLTPDDRKALKAAIQGMVRRSTLRATYKAFFAWLGEPERHAEEPRVIACATAAKELETVRGEVEAFLASRYKTSGIVCRTQKLARRVHAALADLDTRVTLLTEGSTSFAVGVVICTAHMAKGFEFDEVIVPHVDAKHYRPAMDRNLLYVACTRAMHHLVLTHAGRPSPLLEE
jgi:DNA helicase-2/ATP-dependent DNA helicase PcrA